MTFRGVLVAVGDNSLLECPSIVLRLASGVHLELPVLKSVAFDFGKMLYQKIEIEINSPVYRPFSTVEAIKGN